MKRFDYANYADLRDFIEIYDSAAGAGPLAAKVRAEGEKITAFLSGRLILESFRRGEELSRTHGLSVQLPGPKDPEKDYRAYYARLAISKASNWPDFMKLVDAAR